jgi:CheY-like chemotaxis protein
MRRAGAILDGMGADLENKLVLLVEDDEPLLAGMQAWLRDNQYGYAVMAARDGEQALALIERYRPDLVISDLRLPVMDGLQLLLACRRRWPQLRFVVMSAFGTPDLEDRSRRSGAVRFLHKPIDMPALEQTIAEVLQQDSDAHRSGFVHGISVPGFVQLLSVERKTVALVLRRPDADPGTLYLDDGALVHASHAGRRGEPAALALLAWEDAEMELDEQARAPERTITQPLPGLIMEALRRRDEAGR